MNLNNINNFINKHPLIKWNLLTIIFLFISPGLAIFYFVITLVIFFYKNRKKDGNKKQDRRKAECPNCGKKLKKVPGAKTKCPHCSKYMYVRTRPDNVRLVVTKEEADEIDKEWRIENGTQEAFLAEQKRFNDRKKSLKKKFGGKDPSDRDVKWSLLNEEILENSKKAQWGLYRNTRFEMGEILRKEDKLKDALRMYLGVCYLDLNGANNMILDENGNVVDSEFSKPFDLEMKFIAPGIVKRIKRIIDKLDLNKKEVRKIFIDFAKKEKGGTRAPRDPEDCFKELESEIWNKKDRNN